MASDYLSRELKTEIRVGGLDISLTRGLLIEHLSLKDRQHQEIVAAKRLGIIPGRFSFRHKILNIQKVSLEQGVVQLLTHKGDSSLSFQFIIDYFASGKKQAVEDTTPSKPWNLSVSSVQLTDTRFHLNDENSEPVAEGIDYANLDINHINLRLTDFKPDGDTLAARIRSLSAEERSGLAVRAMSGEFRVSSRFLKAKNLKIKTDQSDLDLNMEFHYDTWEAYNDFLNKVNIKAEILPSSLDMEEIGNFAPELFSMKDHFTIAGTVKGTVSNFKAKELRIAFGTVTRFYGNISAMGLPNVEETFVDLNIKSFSTNEEDVQSFKLPANAGSIELPEVLRNTGNITLKGMFTGFYNDFVANARLNTGIGSLVTDLTLRTHKGGKKITYIGQANAQHINLGKLLKSEELGFVTCRGDINGTGLDINTVDLKANLMIDSLAFHNYVYKNIDVKGFLTDKRFNGSLLINDPNLQLGFNGLMDFHDSIPVFDFTSKISHAQLFTLNLFKRDSLMDLRTSIQVNLRGNNFDNMRGILRIDSTWYEEGNQMIPLQRLSLLTSQDKDGQKSYHLVSDFVDADISGNFSFSQIITSLDNFIKSYLESFSMNKVNTVPLNVSRDQQLNFQIRIKNATPVTRVFVPFLEVAPNTLLDGIYDEQKQVIEINGNSDYVELYGMNMRDWFLKATTYRDNLNVFTGCRQFEMKKNNEADTLTILLDSLNLMAGIRADSIRYNLAWRSSDSLSRIGGFASFSNTPNIELKLTDFNVLVDKRYWNISQGNFLVIDTNAIVFHDISFISGNQFLRVNGNISRNTSDTLVVEFNQVDISNADYFIGNPDINLDGILSGQLKLNDIPDKLTVLADLRLDKFAFNKEQLGDASFRVLFDASQKKFDISSDIIYQGNVGVVIPFSLKGNYFMGEKEPRMDMDLKLKNLNLKMVSPFVSSFMTGLKGYASGEVHIMGNPAKPVFHGKVNLLRSEFRITYLNVPYSFASEVAVEEGYFGFDRVILYDSLGNKAVLNGKITHDHFRDIRLDLNVDFTNFAAFQNTYYQNSLFYGNASGTGNVKITGPLEDISIAVKAQNTAGTRLVIPISTTAEVGENEFIIFKKPADTLKVSSVQESQTTTNLSLNLAIQANPTAELEVIFPDQLGSIKAKGSGNFSMIMTPYTDFTLGGTYTVQKGTFLFKLRNLMNYSFTLREGGTIYWTGDPVDANISLSAVYKTRVPLEGLTVDPEKKSVRVPVETVIHLSGKLMNPDISVSLEMPNVDESLKSIVYMAIDTTNKSEMNQQLISILALGQFKSVQGNSANIDVGNTSLSLLTNMANTFTSRFSKNANIRVNYARSTTNAGQEFDIAFSTQALNEKLHIEGLFGVSSMNPNSTAQRASTIVGDIDLRYDISKNRRWQVRGFNRTNTYDDLNLNNAPYTQGIGISYKRDFNHWSDLLRRDSKEKKDTVRRKR